MTETTTMTTTAEEQREEENVEEALKIQTESLSTSKDRGQLTASGAMSIVNIALLREVLNRGPDNNPYYELQIVLLSVSFFLQICAGLLAILVASVTNYYAAHQDLLCSDVTANMCCCRLERKSQTKRVHYGLDYPLGPQHQVEAAASAAAEAAAKAAASESQPKSPVTTAPTPSTSMLSLTTTSDTKPLVASSPTSATTKKQLPPIDAELGDESLCPCYCTTKTMDEHEYELLDKVKHWEEQQTILEERAAAAKIRVVDVSADLMKAKEDLEKLQRKKDKYSDEEFREEWRLIQDKITHVLHEKSLMDDIIRGLKISKNQGQILKTNRDRLMQSTVFKMATFWQGVLNYIFYIIFILSAFITAFGLTAPAGNADNQNANATMNSANRLIKGLF